MNLTINTNDGYLGGEDGAMYATHYGGKTFQWIGFEAALIDGHEIYSIQFLSRDTGFAVGAQGRIIRTVNAGATWTSYSDNYLGITDIAFPTASDEYASTGNSIYKTTDKGQTWKSLDLRTGASIQVKAVFGECIFSALIQDLSLPLTRLRYTGHSMEALPGIPLIRLTTDTNTRVIFSSFLPGSGL